MAQTDYLWRAVTAREAVRRRQTRDPMGTRRTLLIRIWIVGALLALTLLALGFAIVMANDESIKFNTLTYELGTRLADAGLATGFAAVIGLLVWLFQQEQADARQRVDAASQQLAAKNQWLRDFAIQVTDTYGDVKQARRRLQWDVDRAAGTITTKVYDEQMTAISIAQSRFEALRAMADTNLVSTERRPSIVDPLREIDVALSGLISERKSGRLHISQPEVPLSSWAKLQAFVAESDDHDQFTGLLGFSNVRGPYKGLYDAIVAELRDEPTPRPATATAK